eukprot:GHVO01016471.1.p2 GENE.GHVO01016471.1~~GHVO01016471.1.p2  ORF type:complete len:111 (-),score=10.13 GHVO01016471.1:76-408(-)
MSDAPSNSSMVTSSNDFVIQGTSGKFRQWTAQAFLFTSWQVFQAFHKAIEEAADARIKFNNSKIYCFLHAHTDSNNGVGCVIQVVSTKRWEKKKKNRNEKKKKNEEEQRV